MELFVRDHNGNTLLLVTFGETRKVWESVSRVYDDYVTLTLTLDESEEES